MKMNRIAKALATIALISVATISCSKSEENPVSLGTVTVKDGTDGACLLQIEENTVLIPTNDGLKTNPYGKELRAFIQYTDKGEVNYAGLPGITYRSADVSFIDTILTKKPVQTTLNDDEAFGTDPIEIYSSWMTSVEDGYITLHFTTLWGHQGKVHYINLVKGTTEDPLTFELRHNADGDIQDYRGDGIVAFNIRDLLDDSKDSYDITLNYQGFETAKSIHFTYVPGTGTSLGTGNSIYQMVSESYR